MAAVPVSSRPTRRLRTVALVGSDGSGKTTQARRLAADLAARGLPARYRRHAGGRRWFGRLAVALHRRDAEHLLGRRGLLLVESILRWLAIASTLVRCALTREIAVMDRYAVCQYASLRAHGAPAAGAPAAMTLGERVARLAYGIFPSPDLTFILTVDPQVAYERIERRGYDHESIGFLRAADAAYRGLPEYGTFIPIDGNGTPDEVATAIAAHLTGWLAGGAKPVSDSAEGAAARTGRAQAVLLVAGPLPVGASAVGHRLGEAVQVLP